MNYVYIVTAVKRLLKGRAGPSLLQAARKDILVAAAALLCATIRQLGTPSRDFNGWRWIVPLCRFAARRTSPGSPPFRRTLEAQSRYDHLKSLFQLYV